MLRKKIFSGFLCRFFSEPNFITVFFCLSVFSVSLYSAPKVAFHKLEGKNISPQLEKTLNDVIFSFMRELKNYTVEDLRDSVDSGNADFIFTGNIIGLENGIKLELILKNSNSTVTKFIAKEYESSNKILLESRVLVKELFEQSAALSSKKNGEKAASDESTDFVSVSDIDSLAGAWLGEDEIEKVMIMRGGRGVAIWISGISLLLDLKISSGSLIITQKGAPQPRQFVNLPDNIAALASKSVKPIVWEFKTDADKKLLTGLKKTYLIKHNNSEIIEISEVAIPVVWRKD